jgi:hypothetical protein
LTSGLASTTNAGTRSAATIDCAAVAPQDGREMRPSRLAIGFVLALVGIVWVGQGVGLISGSAMTGSSVWAVVGVVLVGLAAVIVVREVRAASK